MGQPNKLIVVWTNGDREVAIRMAFMYTRNSKLKEWWDEVTLIVWGPSAKLLTEDKMLQEYIERIKDAGVELLACKACAESYGVSEVLANMGINVIYTGQVLTDFLKDENTRVITV
ncbi:DsrE family protein [Desulfosporosinus fructosivorans]|uniref:DsrE family protein n=1 Tax=Desulfosporosinus fructosivorans TaxID=2018669 RepID=A0A4Z0R210_9FIRM|nr:DsrE family protein [Desulfosporosinus fructosivorans]TGE35656.1 DsrE family protein [Desulfosporosinus fructosivorans]